MEGGKGRKDETSLLRDPFGVSILLLLLLQDVDLSPLVDDKKVIHVQGRDPIPSFTDSETVKKPIPINTNLAKETEPPYGKSK